MANKRKTKSRRSSRTVRKGTRRRRSSPKKTPTPFQISVKLILIGLAVYGLLLLPILGLGWLMVQLLGEIGAWITTLVHFVATLFLTGTIVWKKRKWLFKKSWLF